MDQVDQDTSRALYQQMPIKTLPLGGSGQGCGRSRQSGMGAPTLTPDP